MDSIAQVKYLSQFLDTHLLSHLLQHNAPVETAKLVQQIKAKHHSAPQEVAQQLEQDASTKAQKLLTLL